jgi:spore germination protein GerM
MPSNNKLNLQLIGAAVFFLLIVTMIWWYFSDPTGFVPQMSQQQSPAQTQEKFQAKLYFTSLDTGGLMVENRLLPKLPLLEARAKLVLNELIIGPKKGQLQATIPPESNLREFYLDEQGCAYLDFDAGLKTNHPGGSYAEVLTIASLVKTLKANFSQVKRVKLLVNGAEIETLAGHIDTRFPFTLQNLPLKPLAVDS